MKPSGLLLIGMVFAEDCEHQVKSEKRYQDGEHAHLEWKFMDQDVIVSVLTRAPSRVCL